MTSWMKMSRIKIGSGIGVGVAAASAVLVTGIPASASTQGSLSGLTTCKDANFQHCTTYLDQIDDLGNAQSGLQDSISSIKNHTGYTVCFYVDNDFKGNWLSLASGYEIADINATQFWRFNDQISSIKAASSNGSC